MQQTATPEIDKKTAALEALLRELVELHTQWLELAKVKREALGRGDAEAMRQACVRENEKLQAVSELEKRRLRLVSELGALVLPPRREPARLAELAEALPEPARGRVLVLRQRLRERMLELKTQTSVARRASESLMKHVQGLIQSIGAVSTGVSTYARGGDRPAQCTAVSTFNVTA